MSAQGSPVHLLKGGDDVLLAKGVKELIDRLVGTADRNEVLDEFNGDDYELGQVIMAATTLSMFGDRVVVARNAGRFGAKDIGPVLEYLEHPSPDACLVLAWERPVAPSATKNPVPKKLSDAVLAAGGEVHDLGVPSGKGRSMWLDSQLAQSPVTLDPAARRALVDRIGDDVSRLGGILTVLEATFGEAELGPDDIEPYLGDAGAVPPWDLTDAIDAGDVPRAVTNLQRMLAGGARHPLQIMVTLQTHVERMLRLDGSGVRDDKAAAALLGMKGSSFPAKKAMEQGRRLGSAKVARATVLLAAADADLRGRTAQDAQAVIETLVARLAALSASGSGRRRR